MDLQGGIVGCTKVSKGFIATLTFRVKSTGTATLKFLDNSKVLLNDGLGTDALKREQGAVYNLILPPPQGPLVASETHPEQGRWYKGTNAIFRWALDEPAEGYSYSLSKEPVDIPDDISEGSKTSVAYKTVDRGTSYFHIKALRGGVWGGTTHFAINVDPDAPAQFPIEIIPGARTTRTQPIINFATTDSLSGIDHYEIKIVPLQQNGTTTESGSLFIEAESPYISSPLPLGTYDVIVRAYDKAGNIKEVTKSLSVVTAMFSFIKDDGVQFRTNLVIPWWLFILFALSLIVGLGYGAWRTKNWYEHVLLRRVDRTFPLHVNEKLNQLKQYQAKYGKMVSVFLLGVSLLSALGSTSVASAQGVGVLEPPVITTVSRNITNEEIFYIGGRTRLPDTEVTIYLQDLQSGEAYSERVTSDKNAEWFYRHHSLLPAGRYLLWAQSKVGEEQSPPSPQVALTVESSAVQFGSSRISYEVLYLLIILVFGVLILGFASYIVYYLYHGKKHRALLMKEIHEAEESIRRGFAVLRRDVQAELAVVSKMKLTKELSQEEKQRESELLRDLDWVERMIGKEVWDVEQREVRG